MIQRIDENIKDLKIGLMGFRKDCFIHALKNHNLTYHIIKDLSDIDESFHFVVESGVYDIIPEEYLSKPKYGIIGIHETPIPEGKGHAPLQWAVLNGRKNITVSLYKLAKKVDAGQIIYQHNMEINDIDTYRELEINRLAGISICFDKFLEELKEGVMVLREQSGFESYHQKRSPKDSEISSLVPFWDRIRICDNEKYPAHFYIGNSKVILRYEVENDNS
jgi:methionyl-tRNA formyltransferase